MKWVSPFNNRWNEIIMSSTLFAITCATGVRLWNKYHTPHPRRKKMMEGKKVEWLHLWDYQINFKLLFPIASETGISESIIIYYSTKNCHQYWDVLYLTNWFLSISNSGDEGLMGNGDWWAIYGGFTSLMGIRGLSLMGTWNHPLITINPH